MAVGVDDDDAMGRALLDRIVATPDDDELRLVYSDYLLERGDLHGELIQLQLRASLTRAETDRTVTLREAHESRWLGPVARVTSNRVWSRGFVVEATIESRRKQDLRAAIGHRAWALVRTIRAGSSIGAEDSNRSMTRSLIELLSGSGMRSLRSIKDANVDVGRGLLQTNADALPSIDALGIVLRRREDTDLAEEAMNGHGLANLRELSISGRIREQRELSLINTNVSRRVEVITLSANTPRLLSWLAVLASAGRRLAAVNLRWVSPGQEYSRSTFWTLTLKRDEDEAWSILEVHGTADDARGYARRLAAFIAELPKNTLTRFAMHLTGETRFNLMYFAEIDRALGTQERLTDENVMVPYNRAVARLRYEDDY